MGASPMKKLSVGDLPSTLGSYLKLAATLFFHDSPAVAFIQKKIDESPNGAAEEVIADESQMLNVLFFIDGEKAK